MAASSTNIKKRTKKTMERDIVNSIIENLPSSLLKIFHVDSAEVNNRTLNDVFKFRPLEN